MRKLFGNSSRGASGGRYVAGKQAERRSAPVQPDVQRPEADDEEIPLLRDYANREAAQHRAETEENDIPLLQQYLKRPPLSQVMPQERHQAPAQPQQRPAQQARPAAQQPQSRPAPQPAQSVPAPRAPRAEAPRPRREEVRDEDLTRDLPRTDAEAPRSGMNGKTRGLILLLASIALFLGSVAMCLALLGRTTAVAPSGGNKKSDGGTSVRVETDAQTGQSIEMDVPDASGHEGIYNILLVGTDGDSTRTDRPRLIQRRAYLSRRTAKPSCPHKSQSGSSWLRMAGFATSVSSASRPAYTSRSVGVMRPASTPIASLI